VRRTSIVERPGPSAVLQAQGPGLHDICPPVIEIVYTSGQDWVAPSLVLPRSNGAPGARHYSFLAGTVVVERLLEDNRGQRAKKDVDHHTPKPNIVVPVVRVVPLARGRFDPALQQGDDPVLPRSRGRLVEGRVVVWSKVAWSGSLGCRCAQTLSKRMVRTMTNDEKRKTREGGSLRSHRERSDDQNSVYQKPGARSQKSER
jgi:hypothetical protein